MKFITFRLDIISILNLSNLKALKIFFWILDFFWVITLWDKNEALILIQDSLLWVKSVKFRLKIALCHTLLEQWRIYIYIYLS